MKIKEEGYSLLTKLDKMVIKSFAKYFLSIFYPHFTEKEGILFPRLLLPLYGAHQAAIADK